MNSKEVALNLAKAVRMIETAQVLVDEANHKGGFQEVDPLGSAQLDDAVCDLFDSINKIDDVRDAVQTLVDAQ